MLGIDIENRHCFNARRATGKCIRNIFKIVDKIFFTTDKWYYKGFPNKIYIMDVFGNSRLYQDGNVQLLTTKEHDEAHGKVSPIDKAVKK